MNILPPARSIYRWQGAIEEAAEVPALFKTTSALAEQLAAEIAVRHAYDLPAVTILPAQGSDALAAWVTAETGQGE